MSTTNPSRPWRSPRRRPAPDTRSAGHLSNRISATMHAELDGTPHAARQARGLVSHMLGEDHPSAGDACLVVSELVANAVAHTRSGQPGGVVGVTVEVSARSRSVLIAVRDSGSPTAPTLTTPGLDGEHGRGLAIVAALAAGWGSEPAGSGRLTWCRLTPATMTRRERQPAARQAPARPVLASAQPDVLPSQAAPWLPQPRASAEMNAQRGAMAPHPAPAIWAARVPELEAGQ